MYVSILLRLVGEYCELFSYKAKKIAVRSIDGCSPLPFCEASRVAGVLYTGVLVQLNK